MQRAHTHTSNRRRANKRQKRKDHRATSTSHSQKLSIPNGCPTLQIVLLFRGFGLRLRGPKPKFHRTNNSVCSCGFLRESALPLAAVCNVKHGDGTPPEHAGSYVQPRDVGRNLRHAAILGRIPWLSGWGLATWAMSTGFQRKTPRSATATRLRVTCATVQGRGS